MKTTQKATVKKIEGGMRVQAQARSFSFICDEPKEAGGEDTGMTPVEALLCALGSCQTIVATSFAKKKGIELKGFQVELEGEAYFEVANDRGHPFIVNTDGMRVRVLGTSFNLHTGSEDAEVIEVTLTEGSVALFTPNNDSDVADRVLSPNQQAIYDPESHTLQVREVRPELYSSWMTGTFVFENNSLQDIAMSLERAFNTHIHIEGEELKNVHLTARFSHGETLDEILSRLEAPAKYQYLRSEGSVYIRPLRR